MKNNLLEALERVAAHNASAADTGACQRIARAAIESHKCSLGGEIRFIGETWQGFVAAGKLNLTAAELDKMRDMDKILPNDDYHAALRDYAKSKSGDFSQIDDCQLIAFGDLQMDWQNEASETIWHDCINGIST